MKTERTGKFLKVGAVVSAFTASLCCLGPLLLTLAGISGAGVFAALDAYRPLFLGVTAILLGTAFYFTYRTPKAKEGEACCEVNTSASRLARWNKISLWSATVLVVGFATFPYINTTKIISSTLPQTPPAVQQATLQVSDLTCGSCATSVKIALGRVPGVERADVNLEAGTIVVSFNPAVVNENVIIEAVHKTGYAASKIK